MINYTPTPDFYNDYICHYNHNHDPKNGQFVKNPGGSSVSMPITEKRKQKKIKKWQNENGSLTPVGKRLFGKIIDLNEQQNKNRLDHEKINKKAQEYFDKHGKKIYKNDKDNKLALYKTDEKYKKISDDGRALARKMFETEESINKERIKLSTSFKIGDDITDKILKNYKDQGTIFEQERKAASDRARKNGYTDGYIKFVEKEAGGFNMVDDPDLFDILEKEYSKSGKKVRR